MKKIIGCFEAKTNFNKIINNVISGEEVFISKRGKPVAKIIPIGKSFNTERVKNAFLRIHNISKEMNLGKFDWEEFKSYRDEVLCARYTSPPLRQMRSPLYTNFFVSYCHPPF